jgi:hypothetical protein
MTDAVYATVLTTAAEIATGSLMGRDHMRQTALFRLSPLHQCLLRSVLEVATDSVA